MNKPPGVVSLAIGCPKDAIGRSHCLVVKLLVSECEGIWDLLFNCLGYLGSVVLVVSLTVQYHWDLSFKWY